MTLRYRTATLLTIIGGLLLPVVVLAQDRIVPSDIRQDLAQHDDGPALHPAIEESGQISGSLQPVPWREGTDYVPREIH